MTLFAVIFAVSFGVMCGRSAEERKWRLRYRVLEEHFELCHMSWKIVHSAQSEAIANLRQRLILRRSLAVIDGGKK